MQTLKKITLAVAACALSSLALADVNDNPPTPTYEHFGTAVAPNGFGGTGISMDAVATANFANGAGTLYLSATPRYDPPLLTNNGAGVFGATAGTSHHLPDFGFDNLALWNFDWDVKRVEGYTYILSIDTNSAAGTLFSAYSQFELGADAVFFDSSNLGFFSAGFNPNVGGEYGFALQAFSTNTAGALVLEATTSILVNVAGPDGTVPEPASIALVGLALGAAGFASRRRKAA